MSISTRKVNQSRGWLSVSPAVSYMIHLGVTPHP